MDIKFYATAWGNSSPFDIFCQKVKEAGYDGVEMTVPFEDEAKNYILSVLSDHDLEFIGQYWQSIESDFAEHTANYEKHLWNLVSGNPIVINCQTGKDYFSFEQNKKLFQLASQISMETRIPIVHETHRGKSLFAAHSTQKYLETIPDLKICLDVSHWCTVHESLLEDQQEAIKVALEHTAHIHSRIGHPQGPQISDPRAPEWNDIVNSHLAWWDQVVKIHQRNGHQLTITTEFGPPPYLSVLPFTQMPVASQWELNVYMLGLLKNRYRTA
jgi:sugar phosphate isomerase/epimerase